MDTLLIDPSGNLQPISPDLVAQYTSQGYVPASPRQVEDYQLQQKFGTPSQAAAAFAEHAGSALTLGLSDVAERDLGVPAEEMRAREEANPIASTAGTVAGVAAPFVVSGGLSALTAPRLIAEAGSGVSEGLAALAGKEAASKIAAKAAISGAGLLTEGAFYGLGHVVHESALGDPNLTAQSAMAQIGWSALLGGALGAGGGVAGALAKKAFGTVADDSGALGQKVRDWLTEFESNSIIKQAGGSDKTTFKKFFKTFGEDNARSAAREAADLGLVTRFSLPGQVLENSERKLAEVGPRIGQILNDADAQATAANLPSAARFFDDAREELLPPLQRNPFNKAAARQMEDVLDDYESRVIMSPVEGKSVSVWHDIRRELDDQIRGLREGWGMDPSRNVQIDAANDLRRMVSDHLSESVDSVLGKQEEWKALNRQYNVASAFKTIAKNGVEKQGNNLLSLTGVMSGLAGATHGPVVGALGAAAATAARHFGSGVLGFAARDLRGALESDAAEALADKTGVAIAAERQAGSDMAAQSATTAPESVAVLSSLEQANQNVARKIDKAASILVRGKEAAKGETADAIGNLFKHSPEDAKEEFQDHAQQLRMMTDPQQQQGWLSSMTNELEPHAPQTAQAMQVGAARAAAFLASKLPQPPPGGPLSHEWTPSLAEISRFNRYRQAVQDPIGVLQQAAHGLVTPEAIEAVSTVYPQLYLGMQQAILSRLTGRHASPIPYQSRLAMSLFMGQDMDGTLAPSFVSARGGMMGQPPPKPPGPSRADKLKVANRFKTPMQQAAERGGG